MDHDFLHTCRSGRTSGLMGFLTRFVPMEKVLGRQFEKGLTKLKAPAEAS